MTCNNNLMSTRPGPSVSVCKINEWRTAAFRDALQLETVHVRSQAVSMFRNEFNLDGTRIFWWLEKSQHSVGTWQL